MEHRLFSWIEVQSQSQEKGVAPSIEKICSQALDFISAGAPDEVRRHLSALLHGSPCKQQEMVSSVQGGSKAWFYVVLEMMCPLPFDFVFLCCCIALDSCGQDIARKSKRDRKSAHLQESNKNQPTQQKGLLTELLHIKAWLHERLTKGKRVSSRRSHRSRISRLAAHRS